MESAAIAHGHGHAEHHGPPIAHQSSRIDAQLLGVLLFIISEAMLFGSFFTAYFFIRVVGNEQWPPHPFEFPVNVALMNTFILVFSSFVVHWALVSIKRNRRFGLVAGLALTLVLGLTFLGLQMREYHALGFVPSDGAFPSTFFALTGLHGMHVFVGATLLFIAFVRAARGRYSAAHHIGLEVTGLYWHFVDVVWILLYTVVYLI